MSNEMRELLPCPFCGDPAHAYEIDGRVQISCARFECAAADVNTSPEQWNRRTPHAIRSGAGEITEEIIELAARNILRSQGVSWIEMDREWEADVARYREMCAKHPDYVSGHGQLNDAFRSARAALSVTPTVAVGEAVAWQPRYKQDVIDHHRSVGSGLWEYAMTVYPTRKEAENYGHGGHEVRALYAAPLSVAELKVTDAMIDAYKAAYSKHMDDSLYGFIPAQNVEISREATRLGLEAALSEGK